MATVTKRRMGPADAGIELTLDEYETADYEPGAKYELIEGRLYVSPEANMPEFVLDRWLYLSVERYVSRRPDILNFAAYKPRVFVPGGGPPTAPEPDLAAYRDFPLGTPIRNLRWQNFSPVLIGEVVSPDAPDKDHVRNVGLYLRIPAVREYWILDGQDDPDRPMLMVYRRRGARWQKPIVTRFGETYATKLLPGFELLVDPQSQG